MPTLRSIHFCPHESPPLQGLGGGARETNTLMRMEYWKPLLLPSHAGGFEVVGGYIYIYIIRILLTAAVSSNQLGIVFFVGALGLGTIMSTRGPKTVESSFRVVKAIDT